jgi:ribonuclease P protein component
MKLLFNNPDLLFTLKKDERLCSRKALDSLFLDGKSSFLFPFKIQWKITNIPQPYPVKVAFSVPKKRFKRATKRNLLKRRMREAYRLNKNQLYDILKNKEIFIHLLFVYVSSEVMTYHELEPKMHGAIKLILAEIQKTS